MKTVVSITPLALTRDSRTLRLATTIAKLGYKSVVVEMGSSAFGLDVPFELRSLQQMKESSEVGDSEHGEEQRPRHRVLTDSRCSSNGMQNALDTLPDSNSNADGADEATACIRPNAKYDGSLVRRCLWPLKPLFSPMLRRYRVLRECLAYVVPVLRSAPRADVYYLHSFRQFPAVFLLCKRYGAHYVYDAHDFYPSIYEEKNQYFSFKRKLYGFLERSCIKRAAAVVTVCNGVAELQRERFGCDPIVVRNLHDPRSDRRPKASLREQLHLPAQAFLLVAVGRPKAGRATQEAIAAMRLCPREVHLAFVGNGYEDYSTAVQEPDIAARVHFVSAVKPQEIVPFICGADAAPILYFAADDNYRNCLPNGFFQSIAAGIPILYPDLPEIRRIAEVHRLGLPIDPRSPDSIADAVNRLWNDREEWKRLRDNVLRAGTALSWENEERIIEDLLQRVLSKDDGQCPCGTTT